MANKESKMPAMEITQFKIVEKDYIVEVPKYIDVEVIVPKFKDVEYERPIYVDKEYERPIIHERDISEEIRQMVISEVKRGIAEAIQSLKVAFEIPMSKILQVRPGGGTYIVEDK